MEKFAISLLLIFGLTACGGGGGSPPSSTPSGGSTSNEGEDHYWKLPPKSGGGDQGRVNSIVRQGEWIYYHYHNLEDRSLFSTNGVDFKSYLIPGWTSKIVGVDKTGRIHTAKKYSDDGLNWIDKWKTGGGTSGYILGKASDLVSSSRKQHSTNGGLTYNSEGLEGPYFENRQVEIRYPMAWDGQNNFITMGKDAGIWVSNNYIKNWSQKLANISTFQVIAGNEYYPNRFFAAHPGKLYTSTDGGRSWSTTNVPKHNGEIVAEWRDMKILDDGTVLAIVAYPSTSYDYFLAKSPDMGKTWSFVNQGKPLPGGSEIEANSHYYVLKSGLVGRIYIAPR